MTEQQAIAAALVQLGEEWTDWPEADLETMAGPFSFAAPEIDTAILECQSTMARRPGR
jgi:hypothetical protein